MYVAGVAQVRHSTYLLGSFLLLGRLGCSCGRNDDSLKPFKSLHTYIDTYTQCKNDDDDDDDDDAK